MVDIGFLGGGQLARMSIGAAQRMGLSCLSLDPGPDSPASQLAPSVQGALDDPEALARVLRQARCVTLENEFIPAEALREACRLAEVPESRVLPGIDTLAIIQDKLLQRRAYDAAGLPSTTAFELTGNESWADLQEKSKAAWVLKARFGGYDGKGTRYARSDEEFESHRPLFGKGGWMAEGFVKFKRELAVMVYRSREVTGCFPTMETVQEDHVCSLVYPSGVDAGEVAIAAVEAVNGYGLFGVELFDLGRGGYSINEIAPRPHNTGHYTLDWGGVSQFEQHVRLVAGLPLARPEGLPVCMANLLGQPDARDWQAGLRAALEVPGVHVHWYGKGEAKPGRKMGHLDAVGAGRLVKRAEEARERFYEAWRS